eukprot:1153761-Amphidinium_carterae.1
MLIFHSGVCSIYQNQVQWTLPLYTKKYPDGDVCTWCEAGNGWRDAHSKYGTYVLVDGDSPIVGHVRGRRCDT